MPEYRETNGIPICPFCQVGTKRGRMPPGDGLGWDFDEQGNEYTNWYCERCRQGYRVLAGEYTGLSE